MFLEHAVPDALKQLAGSSSGAPNSGQGSASTPVGIDARMRDAVQQRQKGGDVS